MAETKNLCAQIPIALHSQVCEAREQSGLTTAEYITNLLIEYFEMKENGGNAAMTNGKNRTWPSKSMKNFFSGSRRTWSVRQPALAVS